MGDVGTSAEIDQGTTSVDGGRGAIRNLVLDVVLFVAVVLSGSQVQAMSGCLVVYRLKVMKA